MTMATHLIGNDGDISIKIFQSIKKRGEMSSIRNRSIALRLFLENRHLITCFLENWIRKEFFLAKKNFFFFSMTKTIVKG